MPSRQGCCGTEPPIAAADRKLLAERDPVKYRAAAGVLFTLPAQMPWPEGVTSAKVTAVSATESLITVMLDDGTERRFRVKVNETF